MADVPAAGTITAILRRHGRLDPQAAASHRRCIRFEHDAPNRLWQMDFQGHTAAGAGRCHPLTVLDDHSRFNLGLLACPDEQDPNVRAHLTALFRRYGLPERGLGGAVHRAGRLAAAAGHRPGPRPAAAPADQGKDERFHLTMKAEVIQGRSFADLAECQPRSDPWLEVCNHPRPRQAPGMAVPASRYRPSERAFPEILTVWEYGPTDAARKVSCDGTISFRGRPFELGKATRGEHLAVRPTVEDGLFGIYFGVHEVAQADLCVQNPPQ